MYNHIPPKNQPDDKCFTTSRMVNYLAVSKSKNISPEAKKSRVKPVWERAMLTGNPLCLLLRKIEATSATLITRGKEITFKDRKKSFDIV